MAISSSGQFHYTAAVTRVSSGSWGGIAEAPKDPALHPGLVGVSPAIEMAEGTITLRCTESWVARWRNAHYRKSREPAREASFAVGGALDEIVEDGDVLTVFRTGTTDLGVTVFRKGSLQAALGAVSGEGIGSDITVEEDPRALEERLYKRDYTCGSRGADGLRVVEQGVPHGDFA